MEPHSDEEYEKQLEEAIKASLVNFTKSVAKPTNDVLWKENEFASCKSQQVEDEKQMFFKKTDLIDWNDNYTYSINRYEFEKTLDYINSFIFDTIFAFKIISKCLLLIIQNKLRSLEMY